MNITLYKAAEQVRELLEQIDPETGELPEGYASVREVVATKAQAVAAYILDREAVYQMAESRANEILEQVKRGRAGAKHLRNNLADYMRFTGTTEIKSDDGTFHAKLEIGRDKSVVIEDSDLLPSDYMREIPARQEPDKVLIKKAIDDGYDVPGAYIVAKDRLTLK